MLICASDDRTCAQLQQYIRHSSDWLLNRLYVRTIGKRDSAAFELDSDKKDKGWPKRGAKGKEPAQKKTTKSTNGKKRPSLTLTQMMGKEEINEAAVMGSSGDEDDVMKEGEGEEEELKLDLSSDAYYGVLKEPLTVIHPLKGLTDPHSLTRVLHEMEPSFVVLYDAELSFVRQLEIYKASRPGKPLRVYFLIYGGSTEEQKYLTALSKEKKAFEHLIRSEPVVQFFSSQSNLGGEMSPSHIQVCFSSGKRLLWSSQRRGKGEKTPTWTLQEIWSRPMPPPTPAKQASQFQSCSDFFKFPTQTPFGLVDHVSDYFSASCLITRRPGTT